MLEEGDTEDLAEGLTEFLDEYADSDEAKIAALITTIRHVRAHNLSADPLTDCCTRYFSALYVFPHVNFLLLPSSLGNGSSG